MIPHVIDISTNFNHEKDSQFWADDGQSGSNPITRKAGQGEESG
jgi:hypothetical protein